MIGKGPKSMETWCGDESSMGNSWDQEEEVEIGMWNNSQQDNRSHDQNTWNYKNKGSNKVCSFSLCTDPPKCENFTPHFYQITFC